MRPVLTPFILSFLLTGISAQSGIAHEVLFTENWKALNFWRIPATEYQMDGKVVEITARKSSSVIYSPVHRADWQAGVATWSWETLASVPPTNLAQKGADDRNIALYFVFLDRVTAEKIGEKAGIKRLLTSKQARILVYTFGGNKPAGTFEPNPYLGERGAIIIKREAITGAFKERADLLADYARAFGSDTVEPVLVGVALASDSDDTGQLVRARVETLVLK
jgi:DUF3047 family protein